MTASVFDGSDSAGPIFCAIPFACRVVLSVTCVVIDLDENIFFCIFYIVARSVGWGREMDVVVYCCCCWLLTDVDIDDLF